LLFVCGLVRVLFAITMVIRQGLRGVGDTMWTLIITSVSSYGVRLPLAWLLGVQLGYGLTGIWIGLCGELVVRALLFSSRFVHGGWKRVKV
jgi:Na+-driven multidrug efflux pump